MDYTIHEEPVFDHKGNQVGVDRIRTPINPPPIPETEDGKVRVLCACGETYNNITTDIWLAWPAAQGNINGQCNCKEYFKG